MVKQGNMYYSRANNSFMAQKGECGGALTATIQFLLESGMVDAALVLKKGSDLFDAVPMLIDDPQELVDCAGSLHCGTQNLAKIVVEYLEGANNMKLAITTKPCDARTLKELIKFNQINQDNVIMLGLNCGGTIPPVYTRQMIKRCYQLNPDQVLKEEISGGKLIIETKDLNKQGIDMDQLEEAGYGRRPNCQLCEVNIPSMADLAYGSWGVIGSSEGHSTFIEVFSPKGAEVLKKASKAGYIILDEPSPEGIELRNKIDSSMIKLAKKRQSRFFGRNNHDLVSVITRNRDEFKKCIKCFGCRDACPMCFCKDCTLELDSSQFNGPGEIPVSLNFHLERMIHMVDSCVNCGQCEDVCPVDIPLARIWQEVNLEIKKIYGYYAGMDDHLPPLSYLIQREK
jgi:formate dehydrogenase (coenzyme F420) beta subunit